MVSYDPIQWMVFYLKRIEFITNPCRHTVKGISKDVHWTLHFCAEINKSLPYPLSDEPWFPEFFVHIYVL